MEEEDTSSFVPATTNFQELHKFTIIQLYSASNLRIYGVYSSTSCNVLFSQQQTSCRSTATWEPWNLGRAIKMIEWGKRNENHLVSILDLYSIQILGLFFFLSFFSPGAYLCPLSIYVYWRSETGDWGWGLEIEEQDEGGRSKQNFNSYIHLRLNTLITSRYLMSEYALT
ncbi:hypothetical protein EYC84_002075 [Monilinia fructicola]|uniref:Uncharacterized protein n=1 Tax=Monilinia fructicola TaxID=38448 RepID=A0A5M9JUN1_MONFR|nr:hypothetical protein EYC84_002075 [Monilinia fructicola]